VREEAGKLSQPKEQRTMDLRFDETKRIAYIKLTGLMSKKIILDAFDATVSDEKYRNGMGRLWDFRDADLSSMDTATIAEMARYSLRFPPGIKDVKVAFVARRELEFGLSRMFEAYSTETETSISVFYTMKDAEAWMSE
jgi:hypothetical protein